VTANSGRHPLPNPEDLAPTLGAWGINNHTQVVAYDAKNSSFAVRLWWLLRWLGHPAVAVLNGGLAAWEEAGLPLSQDLPTVQPARFEPVLDSAACVDAPTLEKGLEGGLIDLVDARAAPRFRGEQEPIDPVAGHVTGAINLPFEANVQENGRFRSQQELAERFREYAAAPQKVVHMCGSGVTACHNLLAMELAGLSGSRLYPGSWSEWITDPARPVTKG
jgi:thiosulfate/3-mercaptopyruvate sulfurtransferase